MEGSNRPLDETSLRILGMLQGNARMTVAEVASRLGKSETAVRERIQMLELRGVLRGYEARVDLAHAGLPLTAVIRGRCDMSALQGIVRELAAVPNVTRVMLMTGSQPVFATLAVRDGLHLQEIIGLVSKTGLHDIEAQLVLQSLIDQRPAAPPPPKTA